MNTRVCGQPPAVALLTALDAYEQWLSDFEGPDFLGTDTRVGQAKLQKVLDIRREAFPRLTQEITELLLAHAHIVELAYECQLRAVRDATRGQCGVHEGLPRLAQRQRTAIETLRRSVAASDMGSLQPGTTTSRRVD